MASFVHAVDYAIQTQVDGVLIAGDLFDNDKIGYQIEKESRREFKRLINEQIHVFYASGNHDPMHTTTFLKDIIKSPFFHLYDSDEIIEECVTLITHDEETRLHIVGCGHKTKHEKRNLIARFPSKSNDDVYIGLAHASVPSAQSVSEKEDYMAVALNQIQALQYDYFALGHIHIRQLLAPKVAYSGNIQGLNYKETGDKGGYLVTIAHGVTEIEPVAFNQIEWLKLSLDIPESITSLHELEAVLISRVQSQVIHSNRAARDCIVRITISGRTPLYAALNQGENLEELAESISQEIGLLEVNIKLGHLGSLIDREAYIEEKTILSESLKVAENWQEIPLLKDKLLSLPFINSKWSEAEKIEVMNEIMATIDDDILSRLVKVNHEDK